MVVGDRIKNKIRNHNLICSPAGSTAAPTTDTKQQPKASTPSTGGRTQATTSCDDSVVLLTKEQDPPAITEERNLSSEALTPGFLGDFDYDADMAAVAAPGKGVVLPPARLEANQLRELLREEFSDPHILSIQSHVCRDYVGNKAGALCLQLLGHDVDVINSVEFSSMYVHEGMKHSGASLLTWWEGIKKSIQDNKCGGHPGAGSAAVAVGGGTPVFPDDVNAFHQEKRIELVERDQRHDIPVLLCGYMGTGGAVDTVCKIASELKSGACTAWPYVTIDTRLRQLMSPAGQGKMQNLKNKLKAHKGGEKLREVDVQETLRLSQNELKSCAFNSLRTPAGCICVVDPAMGDNGRLYVEETCRKSYANLVRHHADVITPNHYELGWLIEDLSPFSRTSGDPLSPFSNLGEVGAAINTLHRGGVELDHWNSNSEGVSMVVVSSVHFPSKAQDMLFLVASLELRRSDMQISSRERHVGVVPFKRLPIYRGGTGDCFTALLLNRLLCLSRDRFSSGLSQNLTRAELTHQLELIIKDVLCLLQVMLLRSASSDPNGVDLNIVKLKEAIQGGIWSDKHRTHKMIADKMFPNAKFKSFTQASQMPRDAFEKQIITFIENSFTF